MSTKYVFVNLVATNLFFQKEENRFWTWETSDGMTRNQSGFMLYSDQKCEVITKVDIGSDHRMVQARIEMNKT